MIGRHDLPEGYQAEPVSDGTLRGKEVIAVIMICVMALGPLAVTAYQNPYTGAIQATPNLPNA
jgi:hypothetical protein